MDGAMLIPAAIIAVGGILKLTFDALKEKDRVFVKAIESIETRHEKFLGNHMSTFTRTQEANTSAMESVALGLAEVLKAQDSLNTGVQLLHEDNALTARLLHAADAKTADTLKQADAGREI